VKILTRILPAASVVACIAASASPAFASTDNAGSYGGTGTVYVQTDNTAGNQVVSYQRAADGALTETGSYATGGLGGVLGGSVVDHTASQGSLQYDRPFGLVLAVNAGSNTVSVFDAHGGQLALRQVIGSGGTFPVSIATHGDLVYVLNALNGGSVYGYRVIAGHLFPLPGSGRALGLNPNETPQFLNTPGQVSFTPNGSQVIVTTKNNGNDIDVFGVDPFGYLSATPTVNSEPGDVPFAISYDRYGHVVIAEAGPSAIETFALHRDGTLQPLASALTGQAATCWVARDGRYFYTSNAGSADVSGYRTTAAGGLVSLGNTATDAGTVDAVASGGYLYVRAGAAGIVDEYHVNAGGSLTKIGSITVPGAVGGEGIAAS
jgi:hypothetical protein